MTDNSDVHRPAPAMAVDFLREVHPFSELDEETLHGLARHMRIDFFPKGTRLLTAGETELTHLYLVQKGGVRCFITDEDDNVTLKDFRGEGAYIGALGIIRGTRANLNVETVEDTFCFLLPKEAFLELIENQPGFAQYYLKSFSEKLVGTAYSELRHRRMGRRSEDRLHLFTEQVGDIIKRPPCKIAADASIQEAAQAMSANRVGSLLVHDPADPEDIQGIITDRDLRAKVVARALDVRRPVREIMSSPVATVLSRAVCFDVLLKMMSTGIHHLAVERRGRIIGVITSHDVMLLQGSSPYYLLKEIGKQERIRDLYPLSRKIPGIIRGLLKEGARPGNIARMISILNDQILTRLLSLIEADMGRPPLPYCWLLLGSEGRREQTFKTDQDNAIVYADPENEDQAREAEAWFTGFARQAIEHLVACGYPLCPGEIMATNPRWRQPLSAWKDYFQSWVRSPDREEILNSTIFFDFRAGFGDHGLADQLRLHLDQALERSDIFQLHLARECMAARIPLSFFRNFIVEKDGEHKNTLDIKKQGIQPFVNFARVLALRHGVHETNTLARFQVLSAEGRIGEDVYRSAVEAYEFQMQLRLIHQLHQIEAGEEPDNYIDPSHLGDLERRTLKEAFAVIERLQGVLATIYPSM